MATFAPRRGHGLGAAKGETKTTRVQAKGMLAFLSIAMATTTTAGASAIAQLAERQALTEAESHATGPSTRELFYVVVAHGHGLSGQLVAARPLGHDDPAAAEHPGDPADSRPPPRELRRHSETPRRRASAELGPLAAGAMPYPGGPDRALGELCLLAGSSYLDAAWSYYPPQDARGDSFEGLRATGQIHLAKSSYLSAAEHLPLRTRSERPAG